MAVTFRLPSGKRRDGAEEPPASPGSPVRAVSARPQAGGAGCLAVFFGIFLLFGLAFLAFFAVPAARILSARAWRETPCTILHSEVRSHASSDGDDTYSVAVRYAYVVDGREYSSERYEFLGGSSSGTSGKEAVVRRLPPGTRTVCYVDPANPAEAVLERGLTLQYLFALIPLLFVAIGGGGVAWALGPGRRAERRKASGGAAAWLPDAGTASDPAAGLAAGAAGGPLALKPRHTPLGRFLGGVLVAAIWNGIVGVFVWKLYQDWRGGAQPEGCLVLFLGVFGLVGLLLLLNVPYQLLALANPRARLTLSRATLPLGAPAQLEWSFSGLAGRIRALRVTVEGHEEAQYRRGTSTYTDREAFATLEVVATELPSMIPSGVAAFAIPAGSMHSFESSHNKIVWTLKLHGEIRRWPDVNEEFELKVLPREEPA